MKLQYGMLIAVYYCQGNNCVILKDDSLEIEIKEGSLEDFFEEKELKHYGWGIVNGCAYCEDCLADAAKDAFLEDQAETKREMES